MGKMVDVPKTDPRITCESAADVASLSLGIQNKSAVRATWARDAIAIAKLGDDKLVWPEFANEVDKELQW
jgi:hypothetical protein